MSFPIISFALTPTIDSTFKAMKVGTNQLKVVNFDCLKETMAGRIGAEEIPYIDSVSKSSRPK